MVDFEPYYATSDSKYFLFKRSFKNRDQIAFTSLIINQALDRWEFTRVIDIIDVPKQSYTTIADLNGITQLVVIEVIPSISIDVQARRQESNYTHI